MKYSCARKLSLEATYNEGFEPTVLGKAATRKSRKKSLIFTDGKGHEVVLDAAVNHAIDHLGESEAKKKLGITVIEKDGVLAVEVEDLGKVLKATYSRDEEGVPSVTV